MNSTNNSIKNINNFLVRVPCPKYNLRERRQNSYNHLEDNRRLGIRKLYGTNPNAK